MHVPTINRELADHSDFIAPKACGTQMPEVNNIIFPNSQ